MHKTVPTVIVVVLLSKHKKSYDKCLSRIVPYPVLLVKKTVQHDRVWVRWIVGFVVKPNRNLWKNPQHAQNYFMTFLSDYLFSLKSSLIAMFTREVPSKSYE